MQTVVHFRQPPTTFVVHGVLGHVTVAIRDGADPDAALQISADSLDDLLELAEGIRNAVHVAEIEQLGHDIAVAPARCTQPGAIVHTIPCPVHPDAIYAHDEVAP